VQLQVNGELAARERQKRRRKKFLYWAPCQTEFKANKIRRDFVDAQKLLMTS
jgi:hypothetical protein